MSYKITIAPGLPGAFTQEDVLNEGIDTADLAERARQGRVTGARGGARTAWLADADYQGTTAEVGE